jgi:hypothetical protein
MGPVLAQRALVGILLWVSFVSMLAVGGCQSTSEPDPPTIELLLPVEALPESWEISDPPQSMGPHNLGIGDEDDSYVSFKLKGSLYNHSYHLVFYFPSERKAEAEYLDMFRSEFSDGRVSVGRPWDTPVELSYVSPRANEFRQACTINTVAGRREVCKAMGRYGRYVTIFHSTIVPETISLAEFNDIVQLLDENMVNRLNLNESQ